MADLTQADFDAIPSEAPAAETPVPKKCEKAEGLRAAADLIERFTALDAYIGDSTILIPGNSPEHFKLLCRALGTFKKEADDNYFNATRDCGGGIKVQVYTSRGTLCKRVLLREEDVPEQIIPAVAEQRIPASKRAVYGWECTESVLGAPEKHPGAEWTETMVAEAGKLADAVEGQPLPEQPVPAVDFDDLPF